MTADRADPTGRVLGGVLVRRVDAGGREQVFTARRGYVQPSPATGRVLLRLEDGAVFQERSGGGTAGAFDALTLEAPSAAAVERFRARGSGPRELTMPELLVRMTSAGPLEAKRRAASEFHTRAVRSLSPVFLPLLAMPLAIAAKRARRGAGFVVAAAILLLYEYAIDGAQAVADLGALRPAGTVWGPFAVFAGPCLGLYVISRRRPGQTALTAVVEGVGRGVEAVAGWFRRPASRRAATASR
jgi:lipopolysaccharide export system permease protein